MTNGGQAEWQGDLTPEDSGLGGHVTNAVEADAALVAAQEEEAGLPNFFMPEEELQASIRALHLASSAASHVTEVKLRIKSSGAFSSKNKKISPLLPT